MLFARPLILGVLLVSVIGVSLSYLLWQGQITLSFGDSSPDHVATDLPSATPGAVAPVVVNLPGGGLAPVNLSGADLTGVMLTGVDLSGANLTTVNLTQADLSGAILFQANLCGADLIEADLRGALLMGADLISADLRGADLAGANLVGASLRGADLRGSNLRAASLLATGALLDQAAFDAPLVRAMSAEAWQALALGDADLSGAMYDEETRWPEGFVPLGAIQQD